MASTHFTHLPQLPQILRRDDDDGPSAADRLNSLSPGARAGVIAAIVILVVLIVAASFWCCCWPCCFGKKKRERDARRFKNHQSVAEAGQQQEQKEEQQQVRYPPQGLGLPADSFQPHWQNQNHATQDGFSPNRPSSAWEVPKDPAEPPPAYREVK